MGKDATDANKLLMDVIHVHVKKLNNFGILPKRDPQTVRFFTQVGIGLRNEQIK